jgi:ABC-type Fe3+-siderophore transport system permease subunit
MMIISRWLALAALAGAAGVLSALLLLTIFQGSGTIPMWLPIAAAGLSAAVGASVVRRSLFAAATRRGRLAIVGWSAVGVAIAHMVFGAAMSCILIAYEDQNLGDAWTTLSYSFVAMPMYAMWLTLPVGIACGFLIRAWLGHQVHQAH